MNTAGFAEQARFLKLSARSISEGMKTGSFRSCFRGQGIEFDSVREYERGDDIRSIDWNVTARTGKAFVKQYREEREMSVFLIVDGSLSMQTGSRTCSRWAKAQEVAALLAFAAELNSSPVGLVVFDGEPGVPLSPAGGKDRILTILASLEHHACEREGSALGGAIAGCSRILRSRSMVIIVSDFRTSEYERPLGVLSRRHDVIAVRITAPSDSALPSAGYLPFQDPESGLRASLPTGSPVFAAAWEKENAESVQRWERICLKRGASPLCVSVEDDSVRVLSSFFSGRRSRGDPV